MNTFFKSDTGAVTVDWVVLTAGLVGLGLAAMSVVSGGVEGLSNDISAELSGMEINTRFLSNCDTYHIDCLWQLWQAHDALSFENSDNSGVTKASMQANLAGLASAPDSTLALYAFGDISNEQGDLAEGINLIPVMEGYTGTQADRLALAQHYGMPDVATLESAVSGMGATMEEFEAERAALAAYSNQMHLFLIETAEGKGLTVDDI